MSESTEPAALTGEAVEKLTPSENGDSSNTAEQIYKRKAYRLQQEENRKKLKTVKFDEKEKDEDAKLPKVSD